MTKEQKIVAYIEQYGGYDCSIEVNDRTEPLFFHFSSEVASLSYEYEEENLRIGLRQYHRNQSTTISHIIITPSTCEIKNDTVIATNPDNGKKIGLKFSKISGSAPGPFKNNITRKIGKVEVEDGKHICPYCKKACNTTSGLTLHMKNQHPAEYEEDIKYKCPKCSKVCKSASGFTLHKKNCK